MIENYEALEGRDILVVETGDLLLVLQLWAYCLYNE